MHQINGNERSKLLKEWLKKNSKYGFFAIYNVWFLLIIDAFFNWCNRGFMMLPMDIRTIFFSGIFTCLVSFLLIGIFKKGKTAILVFSILLLLLSIVNQIKFTFTREPLKFSDVMYLGSSGEITSIIKSDFLKIMMPYLFKMALEIGVFVFFIILGKEIYKDVELKSSKTRVAFIAVSLWAIIVLFIPSKEITRFMQKHLFAANERVDYYTIGFLEDYYSYYGIISGMYGQLLEDRIWEPENYDENEVTRELSNANYEGRNIFGKPNIIVLFSESFFDISQIDDVSFNRAVTPNLNALKNKGYYFDMISPVYGGVSANTEFEFLMGGNTVFYNQGFVPYMNLFSKESKNEKPSIIKELKNNGYKTRIFSSGTEDLFSCGIVYDYLKIDQFEDILDVQVTNDDIKGLFVSDRFIVDKIINDFGNKESGEKLFYMALTMQGHMPYDIREYDEYDVFVQNSDYSQRINDTITAYAQGVYDADKELGRLYDFIQEIEEPTILIFYGDHLPYLYTGRENAVDVMKYFNTEDELTNIYRKYNVPCLVVGNYDFIQSEEVPKYLGPDLLGTFIINNMDINISNYYKWLYGTRNVISSMNHFISIDDNGNLRKINELSAEQKELFNKRKNIEYYLFVK